MSAAPRRVKPGGGPLWSALAACCPSGARPLVAGVEDRFVKHLGAACRALVRQHMRRDGAIVVAAKAYPARSSCAAW
jgi:hypothetical protein